MKLKTALIPFCVVAGVIVVVGLAARRPVGSDSNRALPTVPDGLAEVVEQIDRHFQSRWQQRQLRISEPADELQVLRRLSLALHGTVPSLEEIREFEADAQPDRLSRWTARMLEDNRFADYFAERLARSFVGTEGGQFIVYRRDRFVEWLGKQLLANEPYDKIVQRMISEDGLWTGKPATNFVTATINEGDVDENKLAGRCVRAFLGQRMDCAQCHDHPFADWKQHEFEGLAAYFGQAKLSVVGIRDKQTERDKQTKKDKPVEYEVEDRETQQTRVVPPAVPFHPEWMPETGNRRERLAAWITHPENRRFERAIANRVWGLMFGKPYHHPVDDLPDPGDLDPPDLLDLLGSDFRRHNCDLRRLIHAIAASRPFRLASVSTTDDETEFDSLQAEWAVFPTVRLRPEQVIGSMIQAWSIKTIDQNSHLVVRFMRFIGENQFLKEYGDLGEDELDERSGTIPQALLRMNSKQSNELLKTSPLSSSGRIAALAGTDGRCLETCYLVCLSRRPTPAEEKHFLDQLKQSKDEQRRRIVEDIFWALFNSPEFSWNH